MSRRAIVSIDIENLEPLARGYREAPEKAREAARRAVNFAAERARTLGAKSMRKQIAFTPGYLDERLKVTKRATLSDLSADVTGRDRPTSLARFANNRNAFLNQTKARKRKRGEVRTVAVTVDPGKTLVMQDAFLVRFKSGALGLAQRGGIGKRNSENPKYRLSRKRKDGSPGKGDYYLRYGPSVDQVFDDTRDEISPPVGRALTVEALRQLRLLGVTRG